MRANIAAKRDAYKAAMAANLDGIEAGIRAARKALESDGEPATTFMQLGPNFIDAAAKYAALGEALRAIDATAALRDELTAEQKKYGPIFALVEPKPNWKEAVDARLHADTLTAMGADAYDLERAVTFYTGSMPKIAREAGGVLHVTAAGYYVDIGA